jgi:hypothetical protein
VDQQWTAWSILARPLADLGLRDQAARASNTTNVAGGSVKVRWAVVGQRLMLVMRTRP